MRQHMTNYVTGRRQNGVAAPDRASEAARLWREFDKLTPVIDGTRHPPTLDEVEAKVTGNVANRALEYGNWKRYNGF